MEVDHADGLDDGRKIDRAIRPAVEAIDKNLPHGLRGILFVYDEETDEGTVALFNYLNSAQIKMDAAIMPAMVDRAYPNA